MEATEQDQEKAAPGTYVDAVESDGYPTLVDDPVWQNLKMLVKPRWCKDSPEGMGKAGVSKTLYPRDFGENKENP
eukprot:10167858-Karenia_brevis.AAC.1